jgi:type III secretion system YscQ/HrcQ family protein
MAALAPRITAIKVPLTVEVGRIAFALSDLEALDAGDIVLIEDPQVRLLDGVLEGPVSAHVGAGHHGVIQGTLGVGASGAYEVAIDQIVPMAPPEPRGNLMQEESQMNEEYARELSCGPSGGREVGQAARQALAERALQTPPRPLPSGKELALDEEHSAGEYDEGEGGGYDEPLAESAGMLHDVAVAMAVELGRVSVSAADVMSLRPGQVIELNRAPGDPVDLVVDGKRLGKGELVEIEGELGVRILELAK